MKSLKMNILDEKEFHHEIPVNPIFNIHASPHMFIGCSFCQSLGHHINNCPYRSNKILLTHIVLAYHRSYPISIHVQSPIPNIQNLVYSLALPNVVCIKSVIPHVYVLFIGNILEQNLVGFPNSMYLHVGPYTPYFVSSYRGVGVFPQCGLLCSAP